MIYAYCRISSVKQLEGLSLSLQDDKELLQEIATKYNTNLSDRVYLDEGQSAYSGKNLKNELGVLLEDINSFKIVAGDIIVMRHLDRLSRQVLTDAMTIFSKILSSGVSIYTTMDNRLYEKYSKHNSVDYILATLSFALANEESAKKSYLNNRHALERIRQFNNNEKSENGNSYDIGVGATPFYISVKNKEIIKHETNFSIAKELIKYALNGNGVSKCATWLYVNHHISYTIPGMSALLKSTSLYGTLIVNIQDRDAIAELHKKNMSEYITKEYTLNGYYPAVCSEDEYFRLQGMIKSRKSSSGNRQNYTLLAGRQFLHCGCGSAMAANYTQQKGLTYYTCIDKKCLNSEKIYVLDNIVVQCLSKYFLLYSPVKDDSKLLELESRLEKEELEYDEKQTYLLENRNIFSKKFTEDYIKSNKVNISQLKIDIDSEKHDLLFMDVNKPSLEEISKWGKKIESIVNSDSLQKRDYQSTIAKLVKDIVIHKDGLVKIQLINNLSKYYYLPEQIKTTGRRLGVKLRVFDEPCDLYIELKNDPDFSNTCFIKEEITEKKYIGHIDNFNKSLLYLYSEEKTRYLAVDKIYHMILGTEDIVGYYFFNKAYATNITHKNKKFISEKQWQTYKNKLQLMFIKSKVLYKINYKTNLNNNSSIIVICLGEINTVLPQIQSTLGAKEIFSFSLLK